MDNKMETGAKPKTLYPSSFKDFNSQSVNHSFGSFEFIGFLMLNGRVTIHESEEDSFKSEFHIHESEEDSFKSEFHRNRDRKGFNDTKSKRHYSGVV
jgi:hypothetical protein